MANQFLSSLTLQNGVVTGGQFSAIAQDDLPMGVPITTRVVLTNDQILALPTTPVELVPAPGAGKIILPVAAGGLLDTTAGAYTNTTNASWNLLWYDSNNNRIASASTEVLIGDNLASTGFSLVQFVLPNQVAGTGDFSGEIVGFPVGPVVGSLFANTSLKVKDFYDALSDYTGGNPANTLSVNVTYVIYQL